MNDLTFPTVQQLTEGNLEEITQGVPGSFVANLYRSSLHPGLLWKQYKDTLNIIEEISSLEALLASGESLLETYIPPYTIMEPFMGSERPSILTFEVYGSPIEAIDSASQSQLDQVYDLVGACIHFGKETGLIPDIVDVYEDKTNLTSIMVGSLHMRFSGGPYRQRNVWLIDYLPMKDLEYLPQYKGDLLEALGQFSNQTSTSIPKEIIDSLLEL